MKPKKASLFATLFFALFTSGIGAIVCFIQLVLTEPERTLTLPDKPKEETIYYINPKTSNTATWEEKYQSFSKTTDSVSLSEQEVNAWSQDSIVIPIAENKPFQLHSPQVRFSEQQTALSIRFEFQQDFIEQLKTNELFLHSYGTFEPSQQGYRYHIQATYINSAKIPWWNPWKNFDSSNLGFITQAFAKAQSITVASNNITFDF